MDREIKFRAWDKKHNAMKTWGNLKNQYNTLNCLSYEHLELMQYTGLEDKNGKEVYEGDVLEFQYRRLDGTYITVKSEVQYGAGQFGIMIDEVGTLTDYMSLCDLIGEVGQEFQVIGNKFIYA